MSIGWYCETQTYMKNRRPSPISWECSSLGVAYQFLSIVAIRSNNTKVLLLLFGEGRLGRRVDKFAEKKGCTVYVCMCVGFQLYTHGARRVFANGNPRQPRHFIFITLIYNNINITWQMSVCSVKAALDLNVSSSVTPAYSSPELRIVPWFESSGIKLY